MQRDSSEDPAVSDQDIAESQKLSDQLRDAMAAVMKLTPRDTDVAASELSALLSRANVLLENEYMVTVRD